ncbi:MAG: response regulator [Kiritimatiellia bacterium]
MKATHPPPSQASSAKTFVMVVDDHPLIRYAISCAIESAPDLVLCGVAMGCGDALKLFDSIQPEVLLLDLNLKDGDGLSFLRVLSSRGTLPRTLILSVCDEAVYASRALDAGAKGYMMKDEPIEKILGAIRKIAEGHLAFSDRVVSRLLAKDGSQGPAHHEGFEVAHCQ